MDSTNCSLFAVQCYRELSQRLLVFCCVLLSREIDESFADAYPGRLTPAETDEAGNPLDETFYGPIWDSDADEPATPAPTVGGLDECIFDL